MEMSVKPFSEVEGMLRESAPAWVELVAYVRTHYIMDELWNDKDEFKFRRSGKTLVTLYIRDGYFTVLLILISDLKEYKNQVKSFNLWVFTRIFIDSF